MDLSSYVDSVRADLTAAAAVGGTDVARAAELVADAVDPALRLVLLDVLTDVANEVTAALDGPVVEVRLRGREPELVVTGTVPEPPPPPTLPSPADDEGTSRLTLRLPEGLKARAEQAAAAEGLSANTWLVRAVSRALADPSPAPAWPLGPRRITGFGRA
jgi:hypothetical protein